MKWPGFFRAWSCRTSRGRLLRPPAQQREVLGSKVILWGGGGRTRFPAMVSNFARGAHSPTDCKADSWLCALY
jgi:hypothetical protein